MNNKIYIASKLTNYKKVIELRDKLSEYGIHLTYDWAEEFKRNKEQNIEESVDDWAGIACTEYIAVTEAQLLFFVCPAGRGGHFELGVAYGRNIPIVLLEKDDAIAFHHLPDIERFSDEEEAIKRIVEIVG